MLFLNKFSVESLSMNVLDEDDFQDAKSEEEEWVLARRGIQLVLNNQYNEAQQLFTNRQNSIQLAAGHCFVVFMVSHVNKLCIKLSSFRALFQNKPIRQVLGSTSLIEMPIFFI